MNIGGGEAADQMVRMMLTGTEVTVRLGASALKKSTGPSRWLWQSITRPYPGRSTWEKCSGRHGISECSPCRRNSIRHSSRERSNRRSCFLSSGIQMGGARVVDVAMPVTELERANLIFERIRYLPQDRQSTPSQGASPHAGFRDPGGKNAKKRVSVEFDLAGISGSSSISKSKNQYGDDS